MKKVKILFNNIGDEDHRAVFEKQLNGFLCDGWQIFNTHQEYMSIGSQKVLMITVVLQNPNASA